MAVNRGKQFEKVIAGCFGKLADCSVDRLYDQTMGYKGGANICDYIVYKYPNEYYIECKSVHGNTLAISSNDPSKKHGNISNRQWDGMLKKSYMRGVKAGIICWWVDRDITKFIPIQSLNRYYKQGHKSLRYDVDLDNSIIIKGIKKRVFFEYDMATFFKEVK